MLQVITDSVADDSTVRFYPVTKRGGPMEKALLPWRPKHQNAGEVSSQKLYFNIESEQHGVLYRIKLRRNQNLFSRKVSKGLHQQDLNCLFSGVIVGDSQSTVGMNLCTGMVGLLLYVWCWVG